MAVDLSDSMQMHRDIQVTLRGDTTAAMEAYRSLRDGPAA